MASDKKIALLLAMVLWMAACSGDGSASGGERVAEPEEEVMTPLVVTAGDDPVPVRGSDGYYHVVYELRILNASPRDAILTSLETIDSESGEVVGSLEEGPIVDATVLVGDMPASPSPVTAIPAGRTVLVLMDDTYDDLGDVPSEFSHRIAAEFDPPPDDQSTFVKNIFPDSVVQETAVVRVGEGEPLSIGPPLEGENWLAVNACCILTPHRGAMLPVSGDIRATERFAIDWIRIDPDLDAVDGMLPSNDGDPLVNEDYLAYGEPLLAVADGTVVAVVDGMDDSTPQELPEGLDLGEMGGNYLILDLGDDFYAFYAHIAPGSFTVAEGDSVSRGEVVALLGNSGNSTEAHLHFHITRAPLPLAGTNWPFVIDRFDLVASLDEDGEFAPGDGERSDEMIMVGDVTDF